MYRALVALPLLAGCLSYIATHDERGTAGYTIATSIDVTMAAACIGYSYSSLPGADTSSNVPAWKRIGRCVVGVVLLDGVVALVAASLRRIDDE